MEIFIQIPFTKLERNKNIITTIFVITAVQMEMLNEKLGKVMAIISQVYLNL